MAVRIAVATSSRRQQGLATHPAQKYTKPCSVFHIFNIFLIIIKNRIGLLILVYFSRKISNKRQMTAIN